MFSFFSFYLDRRYDDLHLLTNEHLSNVLSATHRIHNLLLPAKQKLYLGFLLSFGNGYKKQANVEIFHNSPCALN